MTIYLVLFIFYLIVGFRDLRDKETEYSFSKVLFLMLPMFLMAAFRSENVGNDTFPYKWAYEQLVDYTDFSLLLRSSRLEPGYLLLTYISGRLDFDYNSFQILTSALIYLPWVFFIHRYSSKPGITILLFAILFLGNTMNVVRMQLALSILLFAVPCIEKRKPILFGLIVSAAFMFHHSSFVFAVMYPLSVIRYSKAMTWVIVLSATVIAYLGASFFEAITETIGMYESYVDGRYFDEDRSQLGVYVDLLANTIILAYFYLRGILTPYQYKEEDEDEMADEEVSKPEVDISYFCLMGFWITYALSIVALSNNIMNRISGYFSLSLLLLLPIALSEYNSYQRRQGMLLLIGGCYIARWVVIMVLRPFWNHIVPYETFFMID